MRNYRDAEAEVKVGQGLAALKLNPERRMIVAQIDDQGAALFCPLGPLTRDDLELVDIQGNSLAVSGVLPNQPVRVGDRWELNRELLAVLLGLDAITRSDVQGTLEKLDGQTAILTIQGAVEARPRELRRKSNSKPRRILTWREIRLLGWRPISTSAAKSATPSLDSTLRLVCGWPLLPKPNLSL